MSRASHTAVRPASVRRRALTSVLSLSPLFLASVALLASHAGHTEEPAQAGGPAVVAADCAVPTEMLQVDGTSLPHLQQRLKDHLPVTIVAIGGGSTAGTAAGAADLAYPQRLRETLATAYPDSPITVINKGASHQSAEQMLARFATDVLAANPVLAIWETGTTDAVRGVPIDDFADVLQSGISELQKRGIDIVLVDMQFSRSTAALIDFERYLNTLHRAGDVGGVYVFPRYEIMRHWSEQNVFDFDEVAKADRARLAARVYDCIGRQLADAIGMAAR